MEKKKFYYNNTADKGDINHRWWTLKEGEIYKNLVPLVKQIQQRQQYRRVQNIRHLRFYQNIETMGLYSTMYSKTAQDTLGFQRISLNVIKSCVDTAASKIASMRPRPMFLTDGGSWKQRKRAEQLTKFVDGTFDQMKLYEKKPQSFVDGCVFGTGAVKFFINYDKKRVDCERIISDEIIVDDADGVYGTPRQLFQIKYVNREVLADSFPEKKKEIEEAQGWSAGEVQSEVAKDLIMVVEAWHLPTSSTANDGMKAICIENCDLNISDWKHDFFPFVFDRWSRKRVGFYGMGIAEELAPLQLEINKIIRTIQISQHLMCVPRVWVDKRSEINTQHFSNEAGMIGKYVGNPPVVSTAPGASPELYSHLEYLYQKAFEIVGISQLSAQSKKPHGLDSGRALREFQDIESERFALTSREYEQSFLDCAKVAIALTKELAETEKDVSIRVEGENGADEIKWSEVKMEERDYIMRCFPSSLLPTQPSGKLQTVQELTQAGFIDQETATSLLDFPDIQAAMRLKNSRRNLLLKTLDRMMETKEYIAPEPFLDPIVSMPIAQDYYLAAMNDGADEEQLELIRQFVIALGEMAKKMMPPPIPPPMPGAQPLAVPEAPPTSDLLQPAV